MVSGFTKFKERFQGFENQYVIIGGTACDLIMENEELPFRATKDVDIVLIVESITAKFGRQFWEYVKEAGYEHLNKSTGNAQFYRFTSPKSKEYPYMIEIFSRNVLLAFCQTGKKSRSQLSDSKDSYCGSEYSG